MAKDPNLQRDIDLLLEQCLTAGSLTDELTLLRAALRLYAGGMSAEDALATAAKMLSDSITKHMDQ